MNMFYKQDSKLQNKSFELFPTNEKYRLRWLENISYLTQCNKLALDTGGWIIDGGKFLPEFKFSKLKEK